MNAKCIIVDDEPLAREVLESYIHKVPALALVASCKNALEAIPVTQQELPDIIFCDIKMPELSGLELVRMLNKAPAVIITTAYQEYAIQGFDIGVTDYLVKPIRFERFLKAVTRAMGHPPRPVAATETQTATDTNHPEFLFFKTDGEFVKVLLQEIAYIEAYGNYVRIHTGKKPLVVKDKISAIEALLDSKQFIRIHKSYIIPVQHIRRFFGNTVVLEQAELPVGTFYKKDFLKAAGLE